MCSMPPDHWACRQEGQKWPWCGGHINKVVITRVPIIIDMLGVLTALAMRLLG